MSSYIKNYRVFRDEKEVEMKRKPSSKPKVALSKERKEKNREYHRQYQAKIRKDPEGRQKCNNACLNFYYRNREKVRRKQQFKRNIVKLEKKLGKINGPLRGLGR